MKIKYLLYINTRYKFTITYLKKYSLSPFLSSWIKWWYSSNSSLLLNICSTQNLSLAWRLRNALGALRHLLLCYRGILLQCCGSSRSAPEFYNLSDSVIVILYFILTLSSLGGWYQSVYIYIQICTDWCHLLGGGTAEM